MDVMESIGTLKPNKSKTYIVPLLEGYIDIKYVSKLLKNSFLYIDEPTDYKRTIGLLYEFDSQYFYDNNARKGFIKYEDYILNHELFIDKFDIGNFILYVLEIPEDVYEDYDNFINGKYSKIKPKSQIKILQFLSKYYPKNPIIDKVGNILTKHKSLKEQLEKELGCTIPDNIDLSSKIVIEDETFKLQEYVRHDK